MDPITAGLSVAGLLMSGTGALGGFFSGQQEAAVAQQESQVSQQIAGYQIQENQQRQLAMQLNARRTQTQQIRQTQMAASQAQAAAVGQGAQFSSSAAGGQAGAISEGAFNVEGTNQNLQIGNALFGLTGQIDQAKLQMAALEGQQANLQGQASIFQGIGSFGSSLSSGAGGYGKLFQYFSGGGGGQLGVGPMGEPQYS